MDKEAEGEREVGAEAEERQAKNSRTVIDGTGQVDGNGMGEP